MPYDLTKMQDIKLTEKDLLIEYYKLFTSQQIYKIKQFIADHPNLEYKILNARNWNRLCKSVSDKGFATQWYNNTDYKIDEIVYIFGTPNEIYICIKEGNVGQTPNTSPLYWTKLNSINGATEKSLEGQFLWDYSRLYDYTNWRNFKYVGNWNTTESYTQNNMVTITKNYTTDYGTTLEYKVAYVCLEDNTNKNPESEPTFWLKAMENKDSIGIQVADTPPPNMRSGDIYIQKL